MCQCACRLHAIEAEPILSDFPSCIFAVCCLKTGCEWPLTAQTPSLHSPVNSNGPQRRWWARLWSVYGGVCAYFCWLFLRSAPGLESGPAGRAETDLPWRRPRSAQECRGIGTWLNPTHAHFFHSLLRLHVDPTYENTAFLCVHSNNNPQPQHSVCRHAIRRVCQMNRSVSAWKLVGGIFHTTMKIIVI